MNTSSSLAGHFRRSRIVFSGLLIGLILTLTFLYANRSNHPRALIRTDDNERMSQDDNERMSQDDNERMSQDDPLLVERVKTQLLTPPSPYPYNLTSNSNNTSEYGQNLLALSLLQNKRNGFFIECGALDGEALSNTLLLEKKFGWTGLLIEANPKLAIPLRQKHRKAWTSSACLSTKPYQEVMDFYLDKTSGINSLLNSSAVMQKKYGFAPEPQNAVQVLCIPLYTYLLALQVTIVDYLSLDVEGADFAVLRTIPFDKVIFRVIEVEVQWVAEGKEAFRAFLEEKGYIFVKEIWPDYIFAHSSVQLLQA